MKSILSILICLLASCSSEPETKSITLNQESIDTNLIEEQDNTQELYGTREFLISEMPAIWILLSEVDDVLVIEDSWESQGEKIEFEEGEENTWSMSIYYAQDTELGVITDFEAIIGEGEISIVTGSFVFVGEYDSKPRTINFEWNQMARLSKFTNIGLGSEHFTPEGSGDFFETIVYEREED